MADVDLPIDYFVAGESLPLAEGQKNKKKRTKKDRLVREDLVGFCVEDQVDRLVSGYQKINKISPVEKESLCSFLKGSVVKKNDEGVDTISSLIKGLPVSDKSCSTLIISSSALRCIELHNKAKVIKGCPRVAKLFAKHIKAAEQISLLKGNPQSPVAFGTSGRISSLIKEEPTLMTSNLELIIVDLHRDSKLRNIIDIPETSKPLLELIFSTKSPIYRRIKEGMTKIVLIDQ